jgi:hypothetical protein
MDHVTPEQDEPSDHATWHRHRFTDSRWHLAEQPIASPTTDDCPVLSTMSGGG